MDTDVPSSPSAASVEQPALSEQRVVPDQQHLDPWPYPFSVYIKRLVWIIIYHTIWKLCWSRLTALRPMLLRLLGAKVQRMVGIAGSAWVEMPWELTIGEFVAIGA